MKRKKILCYLMVLAALFMASPCLAASDDGKGVYSPLY